MGEPNHLGNEPPRDPSRDPFIVSNSTPLRGASSAGSLIVLAAFLVAGIVVALLIR